MNAELRQEESPVALQIPVGSEEFKTLLGHGGALAENSEFSEAQVARSLGELQNVSGQA